MSQELTEVLQTPKDQPDHRERREMTVRRASHCFNRVYIIICSLSFIVSHATDEKSRSSLRPRETQRREERENNDVRSRGRPRGEDRDQVVMDRESQTSQRRQSTQSRSTRDEEQDRWSLSSIRPRLRREDREQVNGETQQRSNAVDRQQPARQSDRWSLSSLLPRNRKKRQDTVKEATPTILEAESVTPRSPSSASAWGEPTEVNPGLFLDSPTDSPFANPAFPTLREINIDSIQAPEPRTKDEFLQCEFIPHVLFFSFYFKLTFSSISLSLSPLDACDLTLDPNTAHRRLALSDGDTVATLQQTSQLYPDLPQRFDSWTQVFCLHPLSSDRCYWEVEWRGRGSSLGVVSGSMPRKGANSGAGLGYNSQSWSLELSDMCCAAMHGNQKVEIPVTYSPRVGVFLDRTAGTLTFYSVDDELVPLHTFQGSFPVSLYAAFGVGCGVGVGLDFAMGQFSSASDSIKICPL
uniref:Tripartite motif-containing protein 7-like n=1 Tax=Sinocyclocheilus grahami TaxID=75366 RepID=A0A672MSV6_SINGR